MDDGNLGESISANAQVVEDQLPTSGELFDDPSHIRWWFAASAFPMVAGTLGPVASAFSICALVRPWRQQYAPGTSIDDADTYFPDPSWLIIVNAIQLALALTANLFLLLNMAKRVRFIIAQPVTIAGWYVSAVCLIVLAGTAAGPLQHGVPGRFVWSQAFYYGIWAAILYFVVATLMVGTFYGALTGHYPRDFALTRSQRTLMLQTIMFLMYLLVGALVFSRIEDWQYLDGVYWANVTLFTVGFGDYSVNTTLGRALVIPYALVGVISVGLVIGSIRSLMIDRGSRRMDARIEEKKRRRTVKTMRRSGQDIILEPIRQDSEPLENMPSSEFERRKVEFELMRKIQNAAAIRRKWVALFISGTTWFVLWCVGAVVFLAAERRYQDWDYFTAFYFCFTALTTIGYGDVAPVSPAGKSFFVFWSLLALPTMTVLISNAGDTVVKFISDATLRLGNITILPDETGIVGNFKHITRALTLGRVFSSYTEELHRTRSHSDRIKYPRPRKEPDVPDYKRRLSVELPTGVDLHYILITEIQQICSHLDQKTPRKYTFEEWAWYLKLMGEDEGNPETHRRAAMGRRGQGQEPDPHQWSWVGHKSPLAGHAEESRWIMDRLTECLRQSLQHEKRRQSSP
ncbi:hypothetical protein B0I35DRAFT_480658 [Stachybotrys elegans]|uniref:Potassium channel domain-containing protein n=1 Tax=Stachybotrys elegans TaxID=80388 RepID=A0A8K0SM18_9HYPO|nr:hypothetical protein B0I35DRAFT_480658 [Stachybotrys elegans]